VVLAGEERHLAAARVDPLDVLARVPVEAVVVDVAGIDAGSALAVVPPVLALGDLRARRRAQSERVARAELAAVHGRLVKELVVAPGPLRGRFEPDDAGEPALIFRGDLEADRSAHRAAHDHWPFELQRLPYRADHGEVAARRQAVLREPPPVRRRRSAVIRQVEREGAETPRDLGGGQPGAPPAAVGAGGAEGQA